MMRSYCFFLYFFLQEKLLAAVWPEQTSSNVKILGLFSDAENTSNPTDFSTHSRAMFQAAVLLAQRYNLTVDGQSIEYISSQTGSNIINALQQSCEAVSNADVFGIMGPALSREALVVAEFVEQIQIPAISYSATDPDLSNKVAYPTFYRTVPSDNGAALAIASLFNHFNWSSCIIIYQNDAYGSSGTKIITEAFVKNNLIVRETLLYDIASGRIQGDLQSTLTKSASRVVILWAQSVNAGNILKQAVKLNVAGPLFTWIFSDPPPLDNFNKTYYDALTGMLTVEPVAGTVVNAPTNTTLLQSAYDIWQQHESETFRGPTEVNNYALFAFDAAWSLILALHKFCSETPPNSSCISYSGSSSYFSRRFDQSNSLLNALTQLSFIGVSGPVQFSANSTDRTSGSYYYAQNIQRTTNAARFVPVLSYSESDGWKSYSDVSRIIWPGNILEKPSGSPILRGVDLRIGVIEAAPFTIVTDENNSSGLTGFVPKLIDLLKENMNFNPIIFVTPSNLTYNEIIDLVASGVYDIVVGDVTVTSQRRGIVGFSNSIFDNSLRIITRKPKGSSVDLMAFLKPFSRSLWILLAIICLFGGFLFCLLERHDNVELHDRALSSQFSRSMWYSFGNIVGYGAGYEANTSAGRVLSAGLYIVSIIVLATYTANLASDLTLQKSKNIISSIDDIKNKKVSSYRIGILEGAAMEEYSLREISGNIANYYRLTSQQEAYDRLLDNTIDVSFMDVGVGEYITNNIYCNLTLVGDGFDNGAFGIVTAKDWLYAQDLDVNILKIRESGELENLRQAWFRGSICSDPDGISMAMTVDHLAGLFLTFAIICILSVIVLVWTKRQMILKSIKKRSEAKSQSEGATNHELA